MDHSLRTKLLYALLASVVLAGAWLRFLGLTTYGIWFDEWLTIEQSTRPTLMEAITSSGTHPPLMRLFVRASIACFGEPGVPGGYDLAARLPSAVLGTLGIIMIFVFARRFSSGSRTVGLFAAAFYALSPYGVYYGQEARYYAGMVLFAAWALHGMMWLREDMRSLRRQAYMFLPLVLGIYNHHLFAVLFVVTFACMIPSIFEDPRCHWRLGLPWLLVGLVFIPWFFCLLANMDGQERAWMPGLARQWQDTGVAFFTGRIGAYHLSGVWRGRVFLAPLTIASWGLFALGLGVHLARRRPERWQVLAIFAFSLLFTSLAHHFLVTARFFHHKYLAFAFPLFCLFIGELGAYVLRPSWGWLRAARPAVLWLSVAFATAAGAYFVLPNTVEAMRRIRPGAANPFHKEGYREAAHWIEANRDSGTMVIIFDPFRRRNNVGVLKYYGLSSPYVLFTSKHLREAGSFEQDHRDELLRAKELLVVTAHCTEEERAAVLAMAAYGFPERRETLRFWGAEGTLEATVFARRAHD